MISIFDRRYRSDKKTSAEANEDPSAMILHLSTGLLESINRNVLVGDGFAALRKQVDEVKDSLLQAESIEQITQAEPAISAVLAKYRADTQQAAVAQAIEVQHIFAMLNHALIVVSEGSDRSVTRLSEIQLSLQQTSKIRDIVALKTALADTVNFVEKEAAESRKVVTEELARLQIEVGKAREYIGSSRTKLAGRTEAVARIGEALPILTEGHALYALAYVCGRLSGITQRYGAEVTEELVFRVIRERLEPVARAASLFRWTSSGLVAVFERQRDLTAVEMEVTALNRAPVVHRVALGNRTAVLTMSPSRLVLEGSPGSAAVLVDRLDKFIATCS
jgi:hypothetical protein